MGNMVWGSLGKFGKFLQSGNKKGDDSSESIAFSFRAFSLTSLAILDLSEDHH